MNIREAQNFSDKVVAVLAKEREKQGISRYELAGRCGLSETALGYIEKYERRPTLYTLKMIAAALDIKVFQLIKEIEDPE